MVMAKTILIIEDDVFLQELEVKKMKKEGYNVQVSANGKEAFDMIDKKVAVDLVLLDLLLPDMDGFDILKKIREAEFYHDTPVIIFSNLSETKDVERGKKLGASEFMVKANYTLDELAQKIKSLIG
jgi:DNA-binding response OmpR family regulator